VERHLGRRGTPLLLAYATAGCPGISVVVRQVPGRGATPAGCAAAHRNLTTLVRELRPKAVLLVQFEGYLGAIIGPDGSTMDSTAQVKLWRSKFRSFIVDLQSQSIRPAIILDNPDLPADANLCMSRKHSIAACEQSHAASLERTRRLRAAEMQVLAEAHGVVTFAPTDKLCDARTCFLQRNGKLLYFDQGHLSVDATTLMEPDIAALLKAAATN
jgi:hypothetical protein